MHFRLCAYNPFNDKSWRIPLLSFSCRRYCVSIQFDAAMPSHRPTSFSSLPIAKNPFTSSRGVTSIYSVASMTVRPSPIPRSIFPMSGASSFVTTTSRLPSHGTLGWPQISAQSHFSPFPRHPLFPPSCSKLFELASASAKREPQLPVPCPTLTKSFPHHTHDEATSRSLLSPRHAGDCVPCEAATTTPSHRDAHQLFPRRKRHL